LKLWTSLSTKLVYGFQLEGGRLSCVTKNVGRAREMAINGILGVETRVSVAGIFATAQLFGFLCAIRNSYCEPGLVIFSILRTRTLDGNQLH
jgi:hypothetical protein